jgi:hypothetical protein
MTILFYAPNCGTDAGAYVALEGGSHPIFAGDGYPSYAEINIHQAGSPPLAGWPRI